MTRDQSAEVRISRIGGPDYTREDLMKMDPACLRALFRERIHHTVEVEIYPILLGQRKVPKHIGRQGELILDVWRERGFTEDDEDILWCKQYLDLAARLRAGERVNPESAVPDPFSKAEMAVVHKLIWERRSVRDWNPGKPVPDKLLTLVLEAGRAAPTSCNMQVVRFIVIKDPREAKMVWSDIPTPMDRCVLIVVCYDTRIYETVGHDQLIPHNMMLDCAAAADHMCLMAHALGLGAVWLTCTDKTAARFQRKFGLPGYVKQGLHMALGWPAIASIKSARMPLSEMMIERPEIQEGDERFKR